ncbi:MAG: TrmH family RNA methyltransferase [Kiritimatiellia bacterium]
MLTHAQRKAVTALHRKKGRMDAARFLVEGVKSVGELLQSGWAVDQIFATPEWQPPPDLSVPVQPVSPEELKRLSLLETPQEVLAVVPLPPSPEPEPLQGRWIALDQLQDPGNLGTILRLADWFGLAGVLCSPDCVEWSNPKTVQASMGSVFRIPIRIQDLSTLQTPWLAGAFLSGKNLYETPLPENGVIVLGNEGRGISPALASLIPNHLTIPSFGEAESLNAAMAAAVFCSEWRRPQV